VGRPDGGATGRADVAAGTSAQKLLFLVHLGWRDSSAARANAPLNFPRLDRTLLLPGFGLARRAVLAGWNPAG